MQIGRDKSGRFSKKVVVWLEKLGLLCGAKGTEIWSLASRKVRNSSKENNVVSTSALHVVIDLQPGDLQTAKVSFLLHHKGAPIFQIKRTLFWKNAQICPSLEKGEGECGPRRRA